MPWLPTSHSRSSRLVLGLAVVLMSGLCGCRSTNRFLVIDSDPPGADIWVNGVKQASTTPVTIPFVHYGWFEVRLEKKGYISKAAEISIPTPQDGKPGFDLVAEQTIPTRTVRRYIKMDPLKSGEPDSLVDDMLKRAEAFRASSMQEAERAKNRAPPMKRE